MKAELADPITILSFREAELADLITILRSATAIASGMTDAEPADRPPGSRFRGPRRRLQ